MKKITYLLIMTLFSGASLAQPSSVPDQSSGISPLLIGESCPELTVKNLMGDDIQLTEVLAAKPTILIFYRGGWCPYCNLQLWGLQEIENDIMKLGYQVVALSPDSPGNIRTSVEKHQLTYKLYSDGTMAAANAFGIAYKAPESNLKNLAESSAGKNPGWLPVPSVFVFNTEGTILFEYVNPNYRSRLTGNLLLAVLRELEQ